MTARLKLYSFCVRDRLYEFMVDEPGMTGNFHLTVKPY